MTTLTLIGFGQAHQAAAVRWIERSLPCDRVTVIHPHERYLYSGMLTGVLAGDYSEDEASFDVARFCARAGFDLLRDEAVDVDFGTRRIRLASGKLLPFDLLSIDVGVRSRSVWDDGQEGGDPGDPLVVPVKPIEGFLPKLRAAIDSVARVETPPESESSEYRRGASPITVVGGGAAGVEIACTLPAWLARNGPGVDWQLRIATAGTRLLENLPDRAERLDRERLRELGVGVELETPIRFTAERRAERDRRGDREIFVLATGPTPLAWRGADSLGADDGYVPVRPTLQTIADDRTFALGDAIEWPGTPLAKAGVHAVRQGELLATNVARRIRGDSLRDYRPRRWMLRLLNLGDGTALFAYGPFAFRGRAPMRLKDRIDRAWMRKLRP